MLEITYQTLIAETIELRQYYAASVAKEKSIEKKLASRKNSLEESAQLEADLINQRFISKELHVNLQEKELEVQKTYTQKQIFIAGQRAQHASGSIDPRRATLVIIAVMTFWALIGVVLNLKSNLK